MPFTFRELDIPGLILVEARAFTDERGFFMETYKQSAFAANGIPGPFVQDNTSYSRKGVLRGLHFQRAPKAQGKLVMARQGEIFDVAVDLREGSPTYGQWAGEKLSDKNRRLLYVPPGFAHGFCVLSDEAYVTYKVTTEYAPEADRGVIWNDPEIGIDWPIEVPILSPRDAQLPRLSQADSNFTFEAESAE